MKYKICLLLVFLFSFCGSCIKTYAISTSFNLYKIQDEFDENFIFQENGVRIIYKTANKEENEKEFVKAKLESEFNGDIEVTNNEIHIRTSLEDIDVNFLANDDVTTVNLTIINYDKKITILKLMKELTKLQSKNVFDIRYFQYIKGKINNVDDIQFKLKKLHEIKKIDTLYIHNGYVGTGNFNNGERVNIALNSYDTGDYLIIGTPVIFTTY